MYMYVYVCMYVDMIIFNLKLQNTNLCKYEDPREHRLGHKLFIMRNNHVSLTIQYMKLIHFLYICMNKIETEHKYITLK